ncbi:hypothetical protein XaclCFBP3371_18895 [Xanthomonas euvesicatoria pv. citrumelonis]|nr:hypothetical protein XaclCFBP3371_18895 [Xanthomonas euvesicatoria pv. citrumelonis]TKA14449.1 hypothetical protein TN51_17680 [Xanthomonas euvesicatoria pv. citrumelonis]
MRQFASAAPAAAGVGSSLAAVRPAELGACRLRQITRVLHGALARSPGLSCGENIQATSVNSTSVSGWPFRHALHHKQVPAITPENALVP